jgi:hypothetical protein
MAAVDFRATFFARSLPDQYICVRMLSFANYEEPA